MKDAQREAERLISAFSHSKASATICIDEMLMVCQNGEVSFLEQVKKLINER
jgi:hypothetical protein